ncbi:hypothetical protein IU451_28815 [Nocardia cyriacigeorgica]|uniref:hypothetical protein n=1 Tax=Nocardia cyriacigeorgica TaxID=135487 RepID=UPI001893B849|nr:hypothetical protein [Nocardia cyriacigeorgica]MBF6326505.1 hypothetical protein [Nocardia cyriacigeorgica]
MKPRQQQADAAARVEQAQQQVLTAMQERNRAFVEAVGDVEVIPRELMAEFGLTGREAVHIVNTWRGGNRHLREHLFGPTG